MKSNDKKTIIFGLSTFKDRTKEIAEKLEIEQGEYVFQEFFDKEISFEIKSLIRSKSVYIIQSTSEPANEKIMELLIFIDALKRASALEINVIIPYFGYARQDRKMHGRQPITAKLIADLLEIAGATSIFSFDIHSEQMQGFYNIPFNNLYTMTYFYEYITKQEKFSKDLIIVSPDHGGTTRSRIFAKKFNTTMAIIDKRRNKNNQVILETIIGDVKDKDVLIFDDILDTGSTLISAVKILKNSFVNDIYIVVSHCVLSKKTELKTLETLKEMGVKKIFTTNTIPIHKETSFLKIIDIIPLLTKVLKIHLIGGSLSKLFDIQWN